MGKETRATARYFLQARDLERQECTRTKGYHSNYDMWPGIWEIWNETWQVESRIRYLTPQNKNSNFNAAEHSHFEGVSRTDGDLKEYLVEN